MESIPAWLCTNVSSLLLLVFLHIAACRQSFVQLPQQRTYFVLLWLTFTGILADTFSRFYGVKAFPAILVVGGTYVKYLVFPVVALFWFRYVCYQLFSEVGRPVRRWFGFLIMLCGACAATVLLPELRGLTFYFDANGLYHRGPLFSFSVSLMFAMVALSEIFIICHRKSVEKTYLSSLLLFPVPPMIGGLLQMMFYGMPYTLLGISFSLLNVFIHIQNRSMDIDYLTGLFNRRRLDMRMQDLVCASAEKGTFSAMLIDLDHFKQINDQFGHNAGDTALEDSAGLLRQSLRANDFLARYGGDEFCVVLDISKRGELDTIVARMRAKVEEFNRRAGRLYRLSFSIGCAVYDPASGMSMEQFQKLIDALMYEDKRKNHMADRDAGESKE